MKPANQRGDDVGVFGVVVVTGAIKVGGHYASVVHAVACAVLAVVAFAEFDARYFGDGVGLVGRFQRAGEQGVFAHGLGGELGVDAAAAQKEQFFHAIAKCSIDHVGLHHQVVVDEFSRVGVVGMDAADFGSSQVDLVGLFLCKEVLNGGLVG
jgi:hypothetical protein